MELLIPASGTDNRELSLGSVSSEPPWASEALKEKQINYKAQLRARVRASVGMHLHSSRNR